MTATVEINLDTPQAQSLLDYLASLPYAKVKKQTPPCQYTVEEMRQRCLKANKDIEAGRTIPHEEVFKPYRQWL